MTESSSDALTARQVRIFKQIECCFSDVILLCDKFLKDKIQEDDGWVTTDTMLNVNRLKKITDDAQMICKALRKSSSGLMEISEQGDKIRRSPSEPLPGDTKKRIEEIIDRTVYAKSFPLDVKLGDLLKFFENYGQLDNVFMEKDLQKKTFNGSVFVTFANKGDAAKFVNEEETKFKEQALEVKYFHTDYFKHKAAREETKGKKETEGKPHKKDEDKTKEEETEAYVEERVTQKMTKNAVLHLKGLNSETSIEQVKAFFSNVLQSDVAWVDIVKGATEGYIRLQGPDSEMPRENAKAAYNGMVVIQDSEIEVRVVEGDDELQYWKEMFKDIADKKKSGGSGTRQSGRNQRGGRNLTDGRRNREGSQGKRKHNKNEDSSDGEEQDTKEPPAKVIKSEMIIKFKDVMTLHDVSSDGEEKTQKSHQPR